MWWTAYMNFFRVDWAIFERFPSFRVGVLVLDETQNNRSPSDHIRHLLQEQMIRIRENFTLESLLTDPRILQWREAYQSFGAKPRDYRSSIEAMCRRILNGKDIPSISPLVDVYNAISLKYLLTAGGEDLRAVQGDIVLTRAGEHEPKTLLLGDPEPQSPFPGEIFYRDDMSAICRCWNWREADRTKLTPDTKNAVLVLEDLREDPAPLTEALRELQELVQNECGGAITSHVLTKDQPFCPLSN